MAKTLAIKVKYSSDGEEKVIKNVNELETAIESLNSELKELDFGSEEYKRTASELKGLRSALKDVEKETEGLDVEQRLSAIGGALEVVTGTFLIAASAARTFGASAETIEEVEKLEQQALEAVNIALGVRAVTEGLVQAAQLKRVIAEKAANVQTRISTALQTAYTAVVGTSTGALKAFRIALASTGIGLVVVALGALIANWDKLTKSIGSSTTAQDDFNKVNAEALKQIGKTQVELEFYGGIVNDVTKSEDERAEALEELNRLGVITDDITLDNVDSLDLLNERLELARENILLKAQADAAAALLSEALKAQIEAQNSSLEDNISFYDSVINSVLSFGNSWAFASRQVQTGAENQAEAINEAGQDVSRYESLYLDLLEKLNENEAKLRQEREKADKTVKSRNKEKEKRNDVDREYNKILEQIAENAEKSRKAIQLLAVSERDEVKVIQDSLKILEDQNKLLEERLGILGTSQGQAEDFADSFERLIGGILIPEETFVGYNDIFNQIFGITGALEEMGATSSSISKEGIVSRNSISNLEEVRDTLRIINNFQNQLSDSDFPNSFIINTRDLEVLERFFPTLNAQVSELNGDTRSFVEKIEEIRDLYSDERGVVTILDENQQKILLDFFDKQIEISKEAENYNVELKRATSELEQQRVELEKNLDAGTITFKQYIDGLNTLEKQRKEIGKIADTTVEYNELLQDVVRLQENQINDNKTTIELNNEINDLVSARLFDGVEYNKLTATQKTLVDEVTKSLKEQSTIYSQVLDVNKELDILTRNINENQIDQGEKLSEAQFKQLQQFIIQNNERIDQVEGFFNKLGLGSDLLKSKLKELGQEGFEAYLKEMLKSTNLTLEQFEAIQQLINNIKFDTLIENISEVADKVIQEFNNITSGIQNVMASAVSLQLEQLDYFEAQLLASIGDETERAREIQEETRKEIAEQRFELEKKARLQELRFSLAGAVASGAQAVLKALATVPPPAGQILAGVYGGITAAQVAVINDQINFTKGTQFIARRGGLVVGASHEEGGVMANGGSIILEGGEAILNKNAVSQFNDLLSQINVSTGGRSLERDDSALVQEIRKQNQRPIKTYVLYNDIQNTNKINSRLQQISRL